MPRRKAVFILALVPTLMIGAKAPRAEDASCQGAARYVMPDGVAMSGTDAGVAPADLPGSRSGYKLPNKLALDLAINPLGPGFDETRMPLGRVEINRKTGQSTLEGKPLGGPSDAEAACAQAQGKPSAKP